MVDINQQIGEASGTINFKIKSIKAADNNSTDLMMPSAQMDVIDDIMSVHNASSDAHENRFSDLKGNLVSQISLKADASRTYTKTETDTALAAKVNVSDTTITKQGNAFNGANQLVQLDANRKLPAIDGSLLTAVPSTVADANLRNLTTAGKNVISNLPMPSSSYTNLAGVDGSTYTAPADGYYTVRATVAQGGYCAFSSNLLTTLSQSYLSNTTISNWVPVKKGDIATLSVNNATINTLRFIYAEGSKS